MQIDAIDASAGLAQPRADRGIGSLKSEDFFRILVTELQQQDPFKPTETSDMISQVAQVRSIEMSNRLNETLDAIARQQKTSGVSDLLGKYVAAEFTGPDGEPVRIEGVVTGVRFDASGTALLELDTGDVIRAQDVQRVTTLEAAELAVADDADADETDKDAAKARARAREPEPWFQVDTKIRL
jgi:flagellar hook assembly protein FlgD